LRGAKFERRNIGKSLEANSKIPRLLASADLRG